MVKITKASNKRVPPPPPPAHVLVLVPFSLSCLLSCLASPWTVCFGLVLVWFGLVVGFGCVMWFHPLVVSVSVVVSRLKQVDLPGRVRQLRGAHESAEHQQDQALPVRRRRDGPHAWGGARHGHRRRLGVGHPHPRRVRLLS